MLNEILATLQVLSLPTRTNFRSVTKREVALFKGPNGWGEFSPFLEYEAEEASHWLGAGIEAAFGQLPLTNRDEIEINATLPSVETKIDVENILSWYPGAKVVKIKVGHDLDLDIQRIENALAVNPNYKIRLDVNGLWNVKQAEDAVAQIIERVGIEKIQYIEQPVSTIEELRELNLPIPVVGDEVIRKAADPFKVDLNGAVDILMLKVSPLGGINRAKAISAHHKLPVVVSSALESAVGISHGIRLAAALPELNFACGLATGKLLTHDVANLPIVDGRMKVTTVNPSGLLNYKAAPERITWWQNRIRDSFEVWQARN
jgi:O-succinylbenzoate synthase